MCCSCSFDFLIGVRGRESELRSTVCEVVLGEKEEVVERER